MAESEDRTESATARRLQRARDEGQVPVSRELAGLAGLGAAALVLALPGPGLARHTAVLLRAFLAHAADMSAGAGLHLAAQATLVAAAPMALAILVAGSLAVLLQSGFAFRTAALLPDLARISPLAGASRLLGADNLVELLKALVKTGLLGFGIWRVLGANWPGLVLALDAPAGQLAGMILDDIRQLLIWLLAIQGGIALLDLFWVRLRHAQGLRMSRQELRDESRETEGDPHIKARLRRLRQTRMRRRMLAAVPKATLVVTNPTHYAVALAYRSGQSGAPVVLAKGVDEMAARIRAMAEAHHIPLVRNPPLARALFMVEVDAEIPAQHFQAVAELIAYVWRLRPRARPIL